MAEWFQIGFQDLEKVGNFLRQHGGKLLEGDACREM